ncbi:MAG: DUF4142 domain-containing protein [Burkholderiales bacterium]|nr:DUF4142 domain-containing protein [Burkholderiales bacterium]
MKIDHHSAGLLMSVAVLMSLASCKDQSNLTLDASRNKSADAPATDTAAVSRSDPYLMPNSTVESQPPGAGMPSTTAAQPALSSAALSSVERNFVVRTAAAEQFELAVARLAADKAIDSAVKSYAAMLVNDHSPASQKLQQLASSHNLTLPSSLSADKQKELDSLTKASGADFDRRFMQTVGMKDQKEDVDLFEKTSREAKDPDVKEFVQMTLPTLRAHLSAAQNLPASVTN